MSYLSSSNPFDILSLVTVIQLIVFPVAGIVGVGRFLRRIYSHVLVTFYTAVMGLFVIRIRSYSLASYHKTNVGDFVISVLLLISMVSTLLFEVLNNTIKEEINDEKGNEKKIQTPPEEQASFYSILTFWWLSPLLKQGAKKTLGPDDLWELPEQYSVDHSTEKLQNAWSIEKKKSDAASLFKASLRAFGFRFMMGGLLKVLLDTLMFAQPQLLDRLIAFYNSYNAENPENVEPIYVGFVIAVGMFLVSMIYTFMLHQYFQIVSTTGMNLRSGLVTMIYDKSLKLHSSTAGDTTVGKIVNHMSVDAQLIQDCMMYLHLTWTGLIQIVLSLVFLYRVLGVAIFAGFGVMVVAIPGNIILGKRMIQFQKRLLSQKDNRIKMVNELLDGIKVVKLYAWENSFLKRIANVRDNEELKAFKKYGAAQSLGSLLSVSLPIFVSFFTFMVYILISDEPLTTDKIFVSMTLFNILQSPLFALPMILGAASQAWVSINRISDFLKARELDLDATERFPKSKDQSIPAVKITDGSFAWSSTGSNFTLRDVNFAVPQASLTAVVGKVGSGKSSLVSGILGDMDKLSGKVTIYGTTAYAAQEPWILNASVRDNILFGKPFDPELYTMTIEACALLKDLEMLPSGDTTEIGEKGINLSGGQKARVSLARAVYAQADVYLLDDPLSAVDAHVGKHLFDKVIGPNGILRDKARILVTHAMHVLKNVDQVVVLNDGKVHEVDTYSNLVKNENSYLNQLIVSVEINQEEEETSSTSTAGEEDQELLAQRVQTYGQISVNYDQELSAYKSLTKSSGKGLPTLDKDHTGVKLQIQEKIINEYKLITKETSQEGRVKLRIYIQYFKACTYTGCLIFLTLSVLAQVGQLGSTLWVNSWSNVYVDSPSSYKIGVYAGIGLATSLFTFTSYLSKVYLVAFPAAKSTHRELLRGVTAAPMSFFNTTPLGRILNRFSKDQTTIDETLPTSFSSLVGTLLQVLFTLGVISATTPLFLILVVVVFILYYFIQNYYIKTSREIKRLDSVSKSPIYSQFQETLRGTSTIRAYQQQTRFQLENEQRLVVNTRAVYPGLVLNRWLAVRIEFLGALIIFGAAAFGVISLAMSSDGRVNTGLAALSVTYALQVTQSLNWSVRMLCEVETNIVAMERIQEYIELPSEAPYENSISSSEIQLNPATPEHPVETVPEEWPQNGRIEFNDYSCRYREGLDLVLRGVNATIEPMQKVGIVGRTGAGKSSLTLGLFRIIEAAGGSIVIDGQDISKLSLYDLRSKLAIIPQDPVLFGGTLRENLDPFNQFDDNTLWQALEHAHLKAYILTQDSQLDAIVQAGGENFSVGQRQLICLARALLRKSKILVLDEATAAIDQHTDQLIQNTIRTEFKDCTILTIAHRINTIMDSDKILVLDQGLVKEFDTPKNLLKNTDSIFYGLADEAGVLNQ
jgi:ABC-type multidrug transport system fused ATPase/permease subunit